MVFITVGCFAFILFILFDVNKIYQYHRYLNFSFLLGVLVLLFCSAAIVLNSFNSQIHAVWKLFSGALALLFLILLIYALFGAIPFTKTYIDSQRNTVVCTGMYALCRHPGVLWFFFFYLFLGLALGNRLLLVAAFIWTCLNLIYVYIQDRWIFPITLENYQAYKKEVPFLIPNSSSFRTCIRYYWE